MSSHGFREGLNKCYDFNIDLSLGGLWLWSMATRGSQGVPGEQLAESHCSSSSIGLRRCSLNLICKSDSSTTLSHMTKHPKYFFQQVSYSLRAGALTAP